MLIRIPSVSSSRKSASASTARAGRTRARRLRAFIEPLEERALLAATFPEFVDPNPNPGNKFGDTVVALSTGNVVITSPYDDLGGITDAGAVYLFNGKTGSLISTLRGSRPNDRVGSGGVTALTKGNYVVSSPFWDNDAATDAGAVTWGSGTSGVAGVVSNANSLVGSKAQDKVGVLSYYDAIGTKSDINGVTALTNGNYVVSSTYWDSSTAQNVGAVTWGDGTSGVKGPVTSTNSLVGSKADDQVGSGLVTALTKGNYVVSSPFWDSSTAQDVGAVTWGDGTSGVKGVVNGTNSLVGSRAGDRVGNEGVTALMINGNYVVCSPNWANGLVTGAGAVTWGDGNKGTFGVVDPSNSLVGSRQSDRVGGTPHATANYDGVTALTNGNYVVRSVYWDSPTAEAVGAVTWGSGTSGVRGEVNSTNSLVGSKRNDYVGSGGLTELTNGHYVVSSPSWDSSTAQDVGAVTWVDGSKGTNGVVNGTNSLVGSKADDQVGFGGVTALTNGNYVVRSSLWDNSTVVNAGAVTWGDGSKPTGVAVTSTNSLVGSKADDQVGSGGVTALTNGNYVVSSRNWDNGAVVNAGAVTWGSGTSGVSGVLSTTNSLVGSQPFDVVGYDGVTALSNGNYVVISTYWDNGAVANVGAVTWGDGSKATGVAVTSTNSLIGSKADDQVGSGGVTALSNGNYVVSSRNWDNGAVANAGAVTWGSGSSAVSGAISTANSAVGLTANANLQPVVLDNANATFYVRFLDEVNGKVRVGSQTSGFESVTINAGPDQVAKEGDVVSLAGALITFPSGTTIPSVTIVWGDGKSELGNLVQTAAGATVSNTHRYADNGTYTVTLTANFSSGSSVTDSATVAITNVAPTATPQAPTTVPEGTPIVLALVNPTDPGAADVTEGFWYAFDPGDGSGFGAFSPQSSVSIPTTDEGKRLVQVIIRDKDGGMNLYGRIVEITNVAPEVSPIAPSASPVVGTPFVSSGSFTDPGTDTWTAFVDYGDGTGIQPLVLNPDKSFALNHVYTRAGSFIVTVSINDGDYGSSIRSGLLEVVAPPPPTTLQAIRATTKGNSISGIVLTFSAALDVGRAQPLATYQGLSFGPDGIAGNKDDENIPLKSVVYNAQKLTVTLTPSGSPARTQGYQVVENNLMDALGRLIDGDNDGLPGGLSSGVLLPPAILQKMTATTRGRSITALVLDVSGSNPALELVSRSNYKLTEAGKDGKWGTSDDKIISLTNADYSKTKRTVTLTPSARLSSTLSYQLDVGQAAKLPGPGRKFLTIYYDSKAVARLNKGKPVLLP